MSENERNTHFAGFAKLLETELAETLEVYFDVPNATEEQIQAATRLRIAQRAYDLAVHVYDNIRWTGIPGYVDEQIPDLTEWPDH